MRSQDRSRKSPRIAHAIGTIGRPDSLAAMIGPIFAMRLGPRGPSATKPMHSPRRAISISSASASSAPRDDEPRTVGRARPCAMRAPISPSRLRLARMVKPLPRR
jgi:hypothetical protein